jgi:hypothetical protein
MIIIADLREDYDEGRIRNTLERFSLVRSVDFKDSKLILSDIPQNAPFDQCDIRDALENSAQVRVGLIRIQH